MPLTNTFDPITSVNTGTDQITINNHGFKNLQGVLYSNGGGSSIGGLVDGYKYYVIYIDVNTIKLATTEDEARATTAVDLLSAGTGASHTLTESNVFPNSAAYYDFYRRLRIIGDGLPIEGITLEADSVRDTLTIIGGQNITFECDTNDQDQDQFTLNAPNYDLKFLTGTSRLRLYNDAGLDEQVNFKAGTGMTITHNSTDEIEFTSFGVTESDTLESVTNRGYITNNRLVMNNLTVAEIVSTPGVDGVNTVSSTKTGSINATTAGDGTLDAPLRFSNNVSSSSDPNETVTVYFTVPNAGTLSYVANYIAESAILTTGSVTIQRQDPSTLVWTNLDSQSGTLARLGYDITGIYAELYSGPVNYKIIWNWTGNSSFVRISFNVYFEVEPVAGFELIKSDTEVKHLVLGIDDGTTTVRGPTTFTGYIDTEGLRIYQNNIIGTNSNDDIVVDLNGTGALELRATTFKTDQTTFNLINTTATTVNAFGAATTANIATAGTTLSLGGNSGTLTIGNPTVVGTQTTQNLYNTVATTVNAFGAASTIDMGAAGGAGTLTIKNDNVVINGDLQVKGGDITTNQTSFNLIDGTATTVQAFGAATTLTFSTAGGTTTFRSDVVINQDLQIKGGDLTTNALTFNLLNTDATTINAFGAASTVNLATVGTTIEIGNSSGTTNINNNLVVDLDLQVKGGDITTDQTTFNLLNTTATTVNAFGAATTINFGSLIFTGNTIDTSDSSGITVIPAVLFNSDIRANDVRVDQNLFVTGDTSLSRNLIVQGDLTVNGTTVTLNTATLDVEDLNITVAKGSATAAAANGAGLTVDGASATLTYASADDSWNFNKILKATSLQGTPVGSTTRAAGAFTTLAANSDITLTGTIKSNLIFTDNTYDIGASGATRPRDLFLAGNATMGGNLTVNGTTTLGDATTDTITIGGKFVTGTVLRADTTATNTLALAAYDTDTGPGWTNLITLTSSTTPTLTLTSTGVGTINNMSIGATTASTGRFTTLNVVDTTTTGFNLSLASNSSTALSADRTVTFDVVNASRTIKLAGNIDLANNLSTQGAVSFSGAFSFTGTLSGNTSVTFPTTGTLATLAGSESLTNKKLGSLTTNGIVTTSGSDGTLSVTATTGSGSVVLGTSPTIATPDLTFKNAAVTGDADYAFDASTTTVASWIANFTNTRNLVISNLTAGRMAKVYVRNINGTARLINVSASTTATGHAAVNLAGNFVGANAAGQASATGVTLVATTGTAVITVWNAGGSLVGMVN